jgi:Tfp pilus assembly protein PilF
MDYQTYLAQTQLGSQQLEAGQHQEAIATFRRLVESDLADLDKVMMCYNVSVLYQKLQDDERAREWLNRGVDLERRYCRFWVTEQLGAFLADRGKWAESLALYEDLFRQPYLSEQDRERIRQNIQTIRARMA